VLLQQAVAVVQTQAEILQEQTAAQVVVVQAVGQQLQRVQQVKALTGELVA
jgi:hypothetical protein